VIRVIAKVLVGAVAVLALGLALLLLVLPLALHLQRYVITSGSMTGTIDKGTLIYSRLVPVKDLRVGDIITYAPPGYRTLVTHRIVQITPEAGGQLVFRTKGDANPVADPWRFTLDKPTQAVYWFQIPYVGYLIAALSLRWARLLFIAIPAILVAAALLRSIWRPPIGGETEGRGEAASVPDPAARSYPEARS